jgi:hypothetical protein
MRLFEFADDDPLRVNLTAVASYLESRYRGQHQRLSTELFLKILRKHDVPVDKDDLFDIVKKEPLNNIISDLNNNEVIFKGQEPEQDQMSNQEKQVGDNQKTLQQMASRQANKPNPLG